MMNHKWKSPAVFASLVSWSGKLQESRGAHLSQRVTLILLVCLAHLIATPQPIFAQLKSEADQQKLSAEELVASLTASLTSIDSVYCEFTQVQKKGDAITDTRRCRYARFGDKWHMTEFGIEDDKVSEVERTVCFDGKQVYSYSLITSPNGTVRHGTVQIHDSQEPPHLSPEYMLGMQLSNLRRPLPTVLQTNKTPKVTRYIIDDRQQFQLMLSNIPNSTNRSGKVYAYDVTCILDPAHDMLPSDIRIEFSPETKAFLTTHQTWYQRWHVKEFKRVMDESSKKERWFPVKAFLEQQGVKAAPTFELSLENIRLNANLDGNLFNPKIPAGTTIFNLTSKESEK